MKLGLFSIIGIFLFIASCKIKHTCTCVTTNVTEFVSQNGTVTKPTTTDSTQNVNTFIGGKKKGLKGCEAGGSLVISESQDGEFIKKLTKVVKCRFK